MTSSQEHSPQLPTAKEQAGFQSHLILPGILLITLFAAVYLGINWWFARSELHIVRQELKTNQAALKEARMRIEADQVIIRRQMEMLRTAQQGPTQSAP